MYSTEVNGEVTEFGTSGYLYQSNKLMYDRATETLWHQFRGDPVVGELADSGITLEVLPSVLTTWEDWVETHPDTTVLDLRTGVYPPEAYYPESDYRSVYSTYRATEDTMFPVPTRSELLPTKSQIFGLTFNGQERAYPLDILEQEPLINDSLGGGALVVVTPEAGAGARAYQRGGQRFLELQERVNDEGTVLLVDDAGQTWRVEEDALINTDDPSVQLPRLPSRTSFWFGWYAFYPATEVYEPGQSRP